MNKGRACTGPDGKAERGEERTPNPRTSVELFVEVVFEG